MTEMTEAGTHDGIQLLKQESALVKSRRSSANQAAVQAGIAGAGVSGPETFFERGRDFEAVGDAHTYTAAEQELLNSFESLEYLPPNNAVYRAYLSDETQKRPSQWSRWCAMGLIGFVVGLVGFVLKSTIDRIGAWRRSLLFDEECRGDPANVTLYACGSLTSAPSADGAHAPPGSSVSMVFPVFAGVSVAVACAAACVIVLVQPEAASSGLPEVIAYLNGTKQAKIFELRTLIVKFVSCFLAVGSGLPVGPEGPMIHMGAIIGCGVSQARPAQRALPPATAHDHLAAAAAARRVGARSQCPWARALERAH
jgi:chloride channel 7